MEGPRYAGHSRMALPSLPTDRTAWRPQAARPSRTARAVRDPIIEPLWEGIHVLVHAGDGTIRLIDADGNEIGRRYAAIVEALRAGILSEEAIVDGWLTDQATRTGEGLALVAAEAPRGLSILRPAAPAPPPELPHDRPGTLAFVAVDLLLLDGSSVLELPLLERKRLLESVIVVSDFVRVSPYVRPPLDRWLPSWKAVGFNGAVLKAANGRYVPGRLAEDWYVTHPIQRG